MMTSLWCWWQSLRKLEAVSMQHRAALVALAGGACWLRLLIALAGRLLIATTLMMPPASGIVDRSAA